MVIVYLDFVLIGEVQAIAELSFFSHFLDTSSAISIGLLELLVVPACRVCFCRAVCSPLAIGNG
jgi:hypothetical protein